MEIVIYNNSTVLFGKNWGMGLGFALHSPISMHLLPSFPECIGTQGTGHSSDGNRGFNMCHIYLSPAVKLDIH